MHHLRRQLLSATALTALLPLGALLGGVALLVACTEPGAASAGAAPIRVAQANPCAPKAAACGPCGAAAPVELTPAQAEAAYACLKAELAKAYASSGDPAAMAYAAWPRFSAQPYRSATHGQRYVQNYAEPGQAAQQYGRFEQVGRMPEGATLAKDSFVAHPDGRLEVGPLFVMEKLAPGASPDTFGWGYRMVTPAGAVVQDQATQQFCAGCHGNLADTQDGPFFLPEEFRATGG